MFDLKIIAVSHVNSGSINWIQSACKYHRCHLYATLDSFNLRTHTCFIPCVIALLKLLGFRFVFGSYSSLFHYWFCLLLFYSSVANFQEFHANPPQLNQHRQVCKNLPCKVLRLPGFSRVQTCLRFNIAIAIHLKQFRLGMLQQEFVWSCIFRLYILREDR